MTAAVQTAVCPLCGPDEGTCVALVRHGTEPPACGHSACRQHWIGTGDGECVGVSRATDCDRHYCAGDHCPGYPYKASTLAHPWSCVTGERGESDSTWTTIAMLLCIAALLALAFLAPGGA